MRTPSPVASTVGAAAVLGTVLGAGVLSGCNANGQLSARRIVVHLRADATPAQNQALVDRCGMVPHASPVPAPSRIAKLSIASREARFLVQPGTDDNLSRLYTCLNQFPYVLGVDASDG